MRISDALEQARAAGLARLDAQLLLSHCLQRPRTWLLAHDDAELETSTLAAFRGDVARRATGEPLAYIIGRRDFHGLTLLVTSAVLVPRPETELLVDWGLEVLTALSTEDRRLHAIDLGTGSGAIALAVKHRNPRACVLAVDRSLDALRVARANARALALDVEFTAGNWWLAAAGRRFDLALANPPYIDGNDSHLQQLKHEPLEALTPGPDGLAALREVIEGAPPHLNPGAALLLEHGHDQAEAVHGLLQARGFHDLSTRNDLAGIPRCTGGWWG